MEEEEEEGVSVFTLALGVAVAVPTLHNSFILDQFYLCTFIAFILDLML